MRYFCPKCLSKCDNKKIESIFVEVNCLNCGYTWFDKHEHNAPKEVDVKDLVTLE